MDLNKKLDVLEKIYEIYNNFARNLDVACKKGCDSCCTGNVTLTTLEGYRIVKSLIADGKTYLFDSIRKGLNKGRFQPDITINRLAELSIAGKDAPDENNHFSQEECPVLKDGLCPIYSVRPFGCRCFVSKHNCSEKGYAEVDDFILTVNNVFMQYIEAIDLNGCFGNFTDVLLFLESDENRRKYKEGSLEGGKNNLLPNIAIPALMIPPDHRFKVQPIIQSIAAACS
jgi:Fe-S-cluster containining protein